MRLRPKSMNLLVRCVPVTLFEVADFRKEAQLIKKSSFTEESDRVFPQGEASFVLKTLANTSLLMGSLSRKLCTARPDQSSLRPQVLEYHWHQSYQGRMGKLYSLSWSLRITQRAQEQETKYARCQQGKALTSNQKLWQSSVFVFLVLGGFGQSL